MSIADNLQSNRTQTFGYDNLNRISAAQTQGTTGPDCWGQSFGYDAWANLRSATATLTGCPMTQLSLGVNAQNQITNPGFHYDAAGNLLTDGINTYTYDAENRIITLNGTAATYTYNAEGQRVNKQTGSNTTEYVYSEGQPIAENASGVWTDYIFAGSRRLASSTGTNVSSVSNGSFENGLTGWNTQGAATVVTNASNAHSGSNYLQLTATAGTQSLAMSQPVAVQPGQVLSFGGWVNLQSGGSSCLGWMLAVFDSNFNVMTYSPCNSQPPSGWIYEQSTYTVPSGAAYVTLFTQIYLPTSTTVVWADDGFLNTGTFYYHGDHLGSARVTSDAGGNVMWSAAYLPFGQEWNPQATVNHYKFTGKERDSESGLDNFGARFDSSQYGRFMTPDPSGIWLGNLSDPQQLNLYSYVRNNPLSFIDPTGLDCVYLNDAGNGVDDNGIDHNSNQGECWNNGGYWANGNVSGASSVQTDPNSNNVGIFSTDSNGNTGYSIAGQGWTQNPGSWNTAMMYSPAFQGPDLTPPTSQQAMTAISIQTAPLAKLSDCAGGAVANQVPFGNTLLGSPSGGSDPVGTALDTADKMSSNAFPAKVVWGLNKADLPELSALAKKAAEKVVPKLAPYAEKINAAGWIWAGYQAASDTAACYNAQ